MTDLEQIDWSLVATELDISNGHAARMRYSRFKQQMEGTTIPIAKTAKPKKANGKTEIGKSTKQLTKGKSVYDEAKGFGKLSYNNGGKYENTYSLEHNSKKSTSHGDLIKQGSNINPGMMGPDQMSGFTPMMYDQFANATSYWAPNGKVLSSNPSTFSYMVGMTDVQQQQQFPLDPFANMYLAPLPPFHSGDDMNQTFNPGWTPQALDPTFKSGQMRQINVSGVIAPTTMAATTTAAVTSATPATAMPTTTLDSSAGWDNQMDICFSGCCQQPQYPSTPSLLPNVASKDQFQDTVPSQSVEPWAPPPLPPLKNQWVPIKQEHGEGGFNDDIFIKLESTE